MLTLTLFTPLLGAAFNLHAEAGAPVPVILVEAGTPAGPPAGPPDAARVPFSLVFEGPAQPLLPQATYGLVHPALGPEPLDMFLVPVARSPAGIRYEAVFN